MRPCQRYQSPPRSQGSGHVLCPCATSACRGEHRGRRSVLALGGTRSRGRRGRVCEGRGRGGKGGGEVSEEGGERR